MFLRISFLFLILLTFSISVNAGLFIPAACPDQFIGEVVSVRDLPSDFSLAKVAVKIKKIESITGKVQDITEIRPLKNGPIQLQEGRKYKISLRSNKICQAKAVD